MLFSDFTPVHTYTNKGLYCGYCQNGLKQLYTVRPELLMATSIIEQYVQIIVNSDRFLHK